MALVTVLGANASTHTLNYDRLDVAAIARNVAAAIDSGIQSGAIAPAEDTSGPPPTLPGGKTGEWVQTQDNGVTSLPGGYTNVVVTGNNAVIFGSGDPNEAVLSSTGNLTFLATGGSGTVAAGGGNNSILIPSTDSGNWSIYAGNGDDTVSALGAGNDTIAPGGGHNFVMLGSGNDLVQSSGDDTVLAGAGASTIVATGHSDVVYGGTGPVTFIGTKDAATVLGSTGSVTVSGGSGPELLIGGTNGNNSLSAGDGTATLFGAGPGDTLFAGGASPQLLVAGTGNETLFGGHATGNDTLVAGTGNDQLTGGGGSDTFVFTNGQAGGKDLIIGFTSMDKVDLVGYGPNAVADALKTQTVSNNSVTITLTDHTTVTFSGVTSLTTDNFVTPPTAGGGSH